MTFFHSSMIELLLVHYALIVCSYFKFKYAVVYYDGSVDVAIYLKSFFFNYSSLLPLSICYSPMVGATVHFLKVLCMMGIQQCPFTLFWRLDVFVFAILDVLIFCQLSL